MNPSDFVKQIRKEIVEENYDQCKDIFRSTDPENASDPYWKKALIFYQKIEINDREILFQIIRQVMVDTISNVFSILDGVSKLEGQTGNFVLKVNTSPKPLNGDLQSLFLALEEKE